MSNNVYTPSKFYSKENLKFLMYDVHHTDQLVKYSYFSDHDRETFDMFMDSSESIARDHLYPILIEMDRDEPQLINGRINVHPNMRKLMKMFGEGGFIAAIASKGVGGMQMPQTINMMSSFVMACANYSATAFPYLSMGSAELIDSYGSGEMKKKYLPKMFSGEWQGTMALTEPGAGSSLADLVTSAEPTNDGYYKISGQKCFISCGDSNAVDNVIHLMLARIKGAPVGTKGISLFIVPREREENGQLVSNDVTTAGLYHKMGYKGAPIAHLMMGENDDCRGWLVGEEHKGLSYMFQMMNGARISVGLHATSIATAAYYASLQYSQERLQGRPIGEKDPVKPQIPIIKHADVKRMLLAQKTFIEGALSLEIQCCLYEDLKKVTEGDEHEKYYLLLELLTPVAKSYPAEWGCLSTSLALQCLGGYGFTKDFPQEQYYREVRIHPIHEGTTAIHGMDLLGRKIMMKSGKAVMLLMQEVMSDCNEAKKYPALEPYAKQLEAQLGKLQELSMHLMGVAQKEGPEAYLSDATLYLELFSILVICWQWIKIANIAAVKLDAATGDEKTFMEGKIFCLQYYFEYELPKTEGMYKRLKSADRVTLQISEDHF